MFRVKNFLQNFNTIKLSNYKRNAVAKFNKKKSFLFNRSNII